MSGLRSIRPSKGINRRGKIPTDKNGSMVHSESTLERDFVRLADFDPTVEKIYYQPLCLSYFYKGKEYQYFPDYKILTRKRIVHIVEVKPKDKVNEEMNKVKFEVGRKFCNTKGWVYQIATEEQIRPGFLQRNLNLLREAKRYRVPYLVCEKILDLLKNEGPKTIQMLKEKTAMPGPVYYATIYKLIYQHMIHTDMINKKIDDNSLLVFKKEEYQHVNT